MPHPELKHREPMNTNYSTTPAGDGKAPSSAPNNLKYVFDPAKSVIFDVEVYPPGRWCCGFLAPMAATTASTATRPSSPTSWTRSTGPAGPWSATTAAATTCPSCGRSSPGWTRCRSRKLRRPHRPRPSPRTARHRHHLADDQGRSRRPGGPHDGLGSLPGTQEDRREPRRAAPPGTALRARSGTDRRRMAGGPSIYRSYAISGILFMMCGVAPIATMLP